GRSPIQFSPNFSGVHRIAAVVTGTVADKCDLPAVRTAVGARTLGIEGIAQGVHNVDIRTLVAPADIVGAADATALQHAAQGGAMIGHVKPITPLLSVAINRQRPIAERMMDHQWDQLFRKLIGTVIVRAVGDQNWKPVSVVPGA